MIRRPLPPAAMEAPTGWESRVGSSAECVRARVGENVLPGPSAPRSTVVMEISYREALAASVAAATSIRSSGTRCGDGVQGVPPEGLLRVGLGDGP